MQQEITITFHNRGLRSFIEVDLCAQCPRQDDKGCCGYYSPVFYATDFAYLLQHNPDLIERIFSLPSITVLDASVTVNSLVDGDSYRCRFHLREGGCVLGQHLRESVCRHFVCPGIDWQNEPGLKHWKDFFDCLSDYEIDLNNRIAAGLKANGYTMRDPRQRSELLQCLFQLYQQERLPEPEFFHMVPEDETACLLRELRFGKEWPL